MTEESLYLYSNSGTVSVEVKVKQYLYRPGQALRFTGG
jgi:hypothetical protein